MPPWLFSSAGAIAFGRGAFAQLGELVAARHPGARVFVVSDANLAKLGRVGEALASLAAAGCSAEAFDGVTVEPSLEVVEAAIAAGRAFGPTVVVGLGGGSNLDTSKLVAASLAHHCSPRDYAGDGKLAGPTLPLVCVPTTAGTGSEVSPAAVYTDTTLGMKVSCLSPFLRPSLALIDPLLTASCPAKVTADSGIDALAHAVEAFTAATSEEFQRRGGGPSVYQGKNPLADLCAGECVRLVGRFLKRAVVAPDDLEARDGMALAATLGGLAFSSAGVALTHALEYPVGAAVHVSHGAGNGLLLPHVMAFNTPGREAEMAQIAGWLGAADSDAVGAVRRLAESVGIPSRLRDLGVTREMLPGFAAKAFGLKRLLRTNPRPVGSATQLEAVYAAAY